MDKRGMPAHTCPMPLEIHSDAPTMLVRRSAFERAGLARAHFDLRYNLTPDEFRVEGDLIAIGPLFDDEALGALTSELESLGLVYFEDFAELSGNWPPWLTIFARGG
jgi:hypothetical protein